MFNTNDKIVNIQPLNILWGHRHLIGPQLGHNCVMTYKLNHHYQGDKISQETFSNVNNSVDYLLVVTLVKGIHVNNSGDYLLVVTAVN